MNEWPEIVKQCLSLAAPYIVPPLAILLATYLFKFILSNRKTRQYARLLMNVVQGQLEDLFGTEKSKQILEIWNEIVKETEENPNSTSKTYSEQYFTTRMKNEVKMSDDDVAQLKVFIDRLNKSQSGDVSASSADENYKLPVLPCTCEL